MKHTLFLTALAACALSAGAATNLNYSASTDPRAGKDLLSVSEWGYFWNIKNAEGSDLQKATEGALEAITTEDNTEYNLILAAGNNNNITLDSAVYFNTVTVGSGLPTDSITLNLGTEGKITTAQQFNIGNNDPRPELTLNATVSEETLAALNAGDLYTRDLLVAKGNNGFWNVRESYVAGTLTFSVTGLEGLTNVGIVASADAIGCGEYGMVYSEYDKPNGNPMPEKLTLVARIPEPATATLSLLALAGLAARRRRH